jgi:predicted acylesterase/phospholipase RssA
MKIIKHLIIPGGAIYGLSYYGALKHLGEQNKINIENIKTIHATSIGSVIATFLSLKYDWVELDNYIINRPWQEVFRFSLYSIMNCFKNKGIFGIEVFKELFLPLFSAKDIPIDINMKDFYNLTGIELHFFTVDTLSFTLIDVSYKTQPEWSIIESVYASCCLPILFQPFLKNGCYHTDGGFLSNCPIKQLFEDNSSINPEEVLCIDINPEPVILENELTLQKYLMIIMIKIIKIIQAPKGLYKSYTKNTIFIEQNVIPVYDLYSIVNSPENRLRLINHGVDHAKTFCDNNDS